MGTISKLFKGWILGIKPRCQTESSFPGSGEYWRERYAQGGSSGHGSYHKLAEFKAEFLNNLVHEKQIRTVVEFGCGDGNQLTLASYPRYVGYDVSDDAIALCREQFAADSTKRFASSNEAPPEKAELTLSLDVVYHLVEDEVFHLYMERLFDCAERVVVLYSSNVEDTSAGNHQHIRHRQFTRWIAEHRPQWQLTQHVPNRYPFKGNSKQGSFSDFYVFEQVKS